MKSIKKIICAFDILIFFFISYVSCSNPIFCLGHSSLFQKKKTEESLSDSFAKSLRFMDNFLNDVIPKHKAENLFLYWNDVTVGKKNLFDTSLNKNMPVFVQELKEYEYHFYQCVRQLFQYALLQIKNTHTVCKKLTIPSYLDFSQSYGPSKEATIKKFLQEALRAFAHKYSLLHPQYEDIFSKRYTILLEDIIFRLFVTSSLEMLYSSNTYYWKETLNRFILIIDQIQKNIDTESYCHKLFKSLEKRIDPKDSKSFSEKRSLDPKDSKSFSEKIKFFSQYEDILFKQRQTLYPGKRKNDKDDVEYFLLSHEISHMFSFSKEGIKLMLNLINTRNEIDIRYINNSEEFISLLKTLKDKNTSSLEEEYTIGIMLDQKVPDSSSFFSHHPVPIIVDKKANEKMKIYAFDSVGFYCFEDVISSKIMESNNLHASMSIIQKTPSGCHLYSISFLAMALQDMKQNHFDPQDIITLTKDNEIAQFPFPFRWANFCQRTRDIDQQNSQQPLNQQVVIMDTQGKLSCRDSAEFNKDKKAISIPFSCRANQLRLPQKEIYYRDTLEKEASAFCIQAMIDALKNQKHTPNKTVNEDSTIHLNASA